MVTGMIVDLGGTVGLVAGILMEHMPLIIAGVVAMVLGAFMIFEAIKGWCVIRALGIKTPM